jgi:signal transduction histidine kinase
VADGVADGGLESGSAIRSDPVHVLVHASLPSIEESPAIALVSLIDVTSLKLTQAALEDADRRKDAFLAIIAHELRNPLAPIRYAAQLLRAHTAESPTLRQVSGVLERQVQQLGRMIDDLLDLSRLAYDKITLQSSDVWLQQVVTDALVAINERIAHKKLRLDCHLPERPCLVRGDAQRLGQIVVNLLDNAAKFTPSGGWIKVSLKPIEAQDGPAGHKVPGRPAGRQFCLTVCDSGKGIPAHQLPRLFDLFTQGEHQAHGGLGIGLSIAQALAKLHGGHVRAESPGVGRGACFILTLPAAPGPRRTGRGGTFDGSQAELDLRFVELEQP